MSWKAIIFSMALCVAVACSKADVERGSEPKPAPDLSGLTRLSLAIDTDTRTTLDGKAIVWNDGDGIVVNGAPYTVHTDEYGEAYVNVVGASRYEAFYPAYMITDNGIALQPAQFFAKNSFGNGANPMAATTTEGTTLRFRSLCGVLRLRISGSATISSIGVTDKAGGALCGFFGVEGEALTQKGDSPVAHSSVVLNCTHDGGVPLTAEGVDFYIVMPARTYSAGLRLTISDTSTRAMVIDSATPRTIRVNDILATPAIAYSPDADLVFAEHFDKNAWGADRQAKKAGFGIGVSTLEATGYEAATAVATAEQNGTEAISTVWDKAQKNRMTASYMLSRGLGDWQLLFTCMESYGALTCGSAEGRGFVRLPKLRNLPAGDICKATMTFRIALANGAASDNLLLYPYIGGTGKVLAYYVDGKRVETPYNGESWSMGTGKLTATGMLQEKLLIRPAVEIADTQWHTVRIDLGAVTNTTQIHIQPYTKGTTMSEFYIDDIEIRRVAYEGFDDREPYTVGSGATVKDVAKIALQPSTLVWVPTASHVSQLVAQAKAFGMEWVDLNFGSEYLYRTLGDDDTKWNEAFATLKTQLDGAGIKVWGIHLPYEPYGDYSFDYADSSAAKREAAVGQVNRIIKVIAPLFAPKRFVLHPVEGQHYYSATTRKRVADCMNAIIPNVPAGAMLCIENIGNVDSADRLGAQPTHLRDLVQDCPGLRVCFDASHAVSFGKYTAHEFLAQIGDIVECVHMHGGDDKGDIHLEAGYADTLGLVGRKDIIDWHALYKTLVVDCGYRGPFTYEAHTYAVDCIYNYNNLIHNYYDYVYPAYRAQ